MPSSQVFLKNILRNGQSEVAEATTGSTGVASHPLIFNFFKKNLEWGHFGPKKKKFPIQTYNQIKAKWGCALFAIYMSWSTGMRCV
jgi:hypothetical protein